MKAHNIIGLRDHLEQLPPEDLQELLRVELEREEPDPDAVRMILSILEERTPETPDSMAPRKEAAWGKYRQRVEGMIKKPSGIRRWYVTAASLLLILGMFFTVAPQKAEAETFWEMLQRLSATVIEFISRDERPIENEYIFQTDNPGLQQVYDAVVEMGVTEPVVPMWLPEEYELTELTEINTPMLTGISASFSYNESGIVYKIDLFEGEPAHQYYKDDTHYEHYELRGTMFNITRNHEHWMVVWTTDNIECSIFVDCQEETLRRILKSIYIMEE